MCHGESRTIKPRVTRGNGVTWNGETVRLAGAAGPELLELHEGAPREAAAEAKERGMWNERLDYGLRARPFVLRRVIGFKCH